MKILVTGFDPFNNETINPALKALEKLPKTIYSAEIIKLEVPTVFNVSLKVIEDAIKQYQPDVVLSIGQAGGRSQITVERIGINLDDAPIKDNANVMVIDKKIVEDAPDAYFSDLPIKAMIEKIQSKNIPAAISNTAGTFVCNHVLYGTRHLCITKYPNIKSGFIHIPFLPSQVVNKHNVPSMNLDDIVEGLILAIEAIILNEKDIHFIGGTIC